MRQQGESKQRQARTRMASGSATGNVLDAFQVMDSMLMEFSMRLYNVPRRERSILRGHNRRLHRAVRQRHNSRAIPKAITGRSLQLLEKAAKNAADHGSHSRPLRRSRLSAKLEV
jgi:hypothetical protein